MSLARVWRRQLYGASTAALIVPSAMLAALVVLALGGAFSGVGVLGQLFAGPSLPGASPSARVSSGVGRGVARGVATASLPVIPAAAPVVARRRAPGGRTVPTATRRGVGAGGGAIAPVGGTVRPVTQGSGGSAAPVHNPAPAPAAPAPAGPAAPQPSPPPRRTPVDTVVTVVTNVTQQVPAPAGPVATQVVQAAGSAADNLLPVSEQPISVP